MPCSTSTFVFNYLQNLKFSNNYWDYCWYFNNFIRHRCTSIHRGVSQHVSWPTCGRCSPWCSWRYTRPTWRRLWSRARSSTSSAASTTRASRAHSRTDRRSSSAQCLGRTVTLLCPSTSLNRMRTWHSKSLLDLFFYLLKLFFYPTTGKQKWSLISFKLVIIIKQKKPLDCPLIIGYMTSQ